MFEKLKNLIKNNKGFLIKTTILLGMYFFLSDFAFADGIVKEQEEIKSKIIAVLVTLSTTLSVFLGLLTYLVTMFLSPEWITGNIFNMTDNLKSIWILISNVVYFSFAFILIYIAFMNIVGAGGNDYEFKSALPKFIVGILIVPFSWFLVNFMVTLSSILTMAALNLPFDTFKDYRSGIEKVSIPKECTLDLNALSSEGANDKKPEDTTSPVTNGNTKGASTNEIFSCKGNEKFSNVLKTDDASENIFGMISLYTYGLVEIESNFKLTKFTIENTVRVIGDALVKVIFDMIFVIAYSLLMVALGLALMIRGIWLWIYMMLSPLFGLMYFFGKGKDGFFKNFNFWEFLHLCFVPVYTMLALSFGMLFIYQTGSGLTQNSSTTSNNGNKVISVTDNKDIGSSIKINEKFTLNIKGPIAEGKEKKEFEEGMKLLGQIGDTALGTVGALILKLFGIVVLWGTVMMALSRSEITKAIVEPIAKFGESVGDMARTIPQYTPILPGGTSLNTLQQVPRQIQNNVVAADDTRRQKLFGDLGLTNEFQQLNDNIAKVIRENTLGNGKIKAGTDAITNLANSLRGNINERTLNHKESRDNIEKTLKLITGRDVQLDNAKSLEAASREISKAILSSTNKSTIISGMGLTNGSYEEVKKFLESTGSVIPSTTEATTEATSIANSSQKTVNTNQVNGTDNNGQNNQGGNNGQDNQNPPANP